MLETKPSSLAKKLLLPSPGKKFYPSDRQSQVIHSFIKNKYLLCVNQNRHTGSEKGTGQNKMSKNKRQDPPSFAALESRWVGG